MVGTFFLTDFRNFFSAACIVHRSYVFNIQTSFLFSNADTITTL